MYDLLNGLTVVEGASFIAAPSCTLHLAQLGARVIRFDQIGGGPDHRRWPQAASGDSLYWEALNREKLSVGLDLTRPEGRALAQRLATAADGVFVTNFPVDGFLSYDRLAALRPDLICARVMGWADGTPAVDYTVNAALGLPHMTGPGDDARPVNHVLPAWDLLTGAYTAVAVLAAELERRSSGRGRDLRIALADVAAAGVANIGMLAEAIATGADRGRSGNAVYGSFGRDFVTLDQVRLMVVAITPRQWRGLLTVLDLAPAIGALEVRLGVDFTADEGARYRHLAQLAPLVEAGVAARTLAELAPGFDAAGVCWSRYRSLHESIAAEPRLFTANPVFATTAQPSGLSYPLAGAAVRIPDEPRRAPSPAHRLGQDSAEVLGEYLGIGTPEFTELRANGLVA